MMIKGDLVTKEKIYVGAKIISPSGLAGKVTRIHPLFRYYFAIIGKTECMVEFGECHFLHTPLETLLDLV